MYRILQSYKLLGVNYWTDVVTLHGSDFLSSLLN